MTGLALKKFIGSWLMPLPVSVLLLVCGCICLWSRYSRIGRWLVTTAAIILVLCSSTAIPDLLVLPLEERYPKWDGRAHDIELVVVMGASQGDAPRIPLTNRPNTAAVYRLLEGLAVYHANIGSRLILSGGGAKESHALLMAQVARALGVPDADIIVQTESRDTEQEVQLLKPMIGMRRFAVITSAAHMPRTIELFNAAGLYPLAAPTHFLDRDNPYPNWRDLLLPNPSNLERAEFAAHEYLGLLWLRIKAFFAR